MTVQSIEKQLLKLDAASRARIAVKLLSSLDDLTEEENEKLWAHEALIRNKELCSKQSAPRSAKAVFEKARKRF